MVSTSPAKKLGSPAEQTPRFLGGEVRFAFTFLGLFESAFVDTEEWDCPSSYQLMVVGRNGRYVAVIRVQIQFIPTSSTAATKKIKKDKQF